MAVGEANPSRSDAPRRPVTAPGPAARAEEVVARLRERLRSLACCLALTALAFGTRPGAILADTKIDMAVNPLGFLGRALHLWDPEQFGQLQNQAVGYLFPMGPFFALGDLAGMPPWITQRFWLALLMCLAFAGTRRLAERLAIGTPASRMFAAMAYALAPNGLATLGQISSEYLPVAMLPWIILPLATAATGGTGRIRAAARSGLAIACCGGINATATVAVLVVPAVFLLTRPRGAYRMRLTAWWSVAAAAASAWWLVPLLLTGTYGFSWLTYTEKAATTTGPTGLINVLRGGERWVNYLYVDGQVWWPVGHALSTGPVAIICTGVVAALGLAGLLARLLPERTFLLLTLLAGLAIMSAGHIGDVPGPFAGQTRDLLDGALAPLRNVHKFDAVIRLPLAFGIAHLLAAAVRHRREADEARRAGAVRSLGVDAVPAWRLRARAVVSLPVAAAVALGGIGATAFSHGLAGPGTFTDVPKHWRDAASWLNARAGQQAVLAVPGTPFGEYLWGRPMDDIVQPLLSARWGVRQLVPAGSPGYTRAMDAIDQTVRTGRTSPGLGAYLGRMGVRFVLVRNDLRREALRGGWPARLHQALDGASGLRRVAAFGEPTGGDLHDDAVSAVDQKYPALEVYEVAGAAAVASLADAAAPARVHGGPESLLALADLGALPAGPVLLNDDATELSGGPVLGTDTLRLVRRNFGELHQTSPTLTAAEKKRASDVLDDGWERYATTATYGGGVRNVTASASRGGEDAIPQARKPGAIPYAALDGDPFTAWETGGWSGPVGEWLRVDFESSREIGGLSAVFVQNGEPGPPVARVSVETEGGRLEQSVRAVPDAQALRTPPGPTRWVRVRITALASEPAIRVMARAAIAELTVPGIRATRTYTTPRAAGASVHALTRAPGALAQCMKGSERWVCDPRIGARDEEGADFDRVFTAAPAGRVPITGTAVLTDPRLIERYTSFPGQAVVAANSVLSEHPADQPRSAFDADPATTWIAGEKDNAPTLTVRWRGAKQVSSLSFTRPPAVGGPLRVRVEGARGEVRDVLADNRGRLAFAPMTTDRVTLTFRRDGRLSPIQVTDLTVPGVKPLPDVRGVALRLPCGFGPKLRLGGTDVQTQATGTFGDLLDGRPIRFAACRRASVAAGENRLTAVPFDSYRVDGVLIGAAARDQTAAPRPVKVLSWGAGSRKVEVDAAATSFLTVNENHNKGWRATVGGRELRAVRLDGWKQAWIVPAGTKGVVTLAYGPDRAQRLAVVIGLNLLLLLLLAAVWPAGRRDRGGSGRALVAGTGWPAWAALGLAAALAVWTAGLPGLAVGGAVAVLSGWARTRRSAVVRAIASPWTIALLMLAGTGSLAAAHWLKAIDNPASPSGVAAELVPQLLGVAIAARIAVELWRPGGRGRIELSWDAARPGPSPAAPRAARPAAPPASGTTAAPATPPGSSSPPPLRWSPPSEAEDPAPYRPGADGSSGRTKGG